MAVILAAKIGVKQSNGEDLDISIQQIQYIDNFIALDLAKATDSSFSYGLRQIFPQVCKWFQNGAQSYSDLINTQKIWS